MNLHWSKHDYLIIDVEGNGQNPQEIIELAIVPIRQGQIVETCYEWLIKPIKPVTNLASKLHGIFDKDLIGKPEFSEISSDIEKLLGSDAVIGHNVGVDVQLLKDKLPSWQPLVALDTLRLAKFVKPGTSSYALEALVSSLNIGNLPNRKAHRATSDALAAAQLFLTLADILDKQVELNFNRLIEISASSRDPFFKSTQQSLF